MAAWNENHPQFVIARSPYGQQSKLLFDQIGSGFQEMNYMQERRLLRSGACPELVEGELAMTYGNASLLASYTTEVILELFDDPKCPGA
jgi:hypothetical protein